jgi:excisionase family DNA binding protein
MSPPSVAAALVAELGMLSDDDLAPLLDRLAPMVASRIPSARPITTSRSRYLDSEEAAALLRCRRRRIYELVGDGRLTRHGDGRRLLVLRDEVERLAAGG